MTVGMIGREDAVSHGKNAAIRQQWRQTLKYYSIKSQVVRSK